MTTTTKRTVTEALSVAIVRKNTRRKKMIYKVTIESSYTVAAFRFYDLAEAGVFARTAAEHVDADDDGKIFTVRIELINGQEEEDDK
jgi:hypothetical protein